MKRVIIKALSVLSLITWIVGFGLMLYPDELEIRIIGATLLLIGQTLGWLGFKHDTFKSGELPKEIQDLRNPINK